MESAVRKLVISVARSAMVMTVLDDIQGLPTESWSLPMRLGSEASARYMALIRTQLREIGNEEYKDSLSTFVRVLFIT